MTYTSEDVARCCVAGLLMELATTPKPGLVDRTSAPQSYLQFTSSAVALYRHFKAAATDARTGRVIYEASRDMLRWQKGGNTHLGAILLLAPLARAAYISNSFNEIRGSLRRVLQALGYRDTVYVFRAISLVRPGKLGRVALFDVNNPKTYEVLRKEKMGLLDVLKPYSGHEVVATEYVTNYYYSFKHGFGYLVKNLRQGVGLNDAGINTFLNILAHLPDSHVARRHGRAAARTLSNLSRQVLKAGGVSTKQGQLLFEDFSKKVARSGFKPAATADILAVSYALLMLSGYRP
jgi:triphosphoribosyl-dephospho-CoA synthase